MNLVFFLLYRFIFLSNNPMVTRVSFSYAHPDANFRRCIWELTELRYTYNVTRIRGRFKGFFVGIYRRRDILCEILPQNVSRSRL